ncbi:MAG TPA: PPK2 family polyphosphate kinase [Candidatus Dormibacteraeota bacterium]
MTRDDKLDEKLRRAVADLVVRPGAKVSLPRDFDPGHKAGYVDRDDAKEMLQHTLERLAMYQDRLAAQQTFGLLVVLQGMDAAGKDGVVKHVMAGMNPQGVVAHSFKRPSASELRHDYLWRHQVALPERGQVGIFNRSHYEEVVAVRVHKELLEAQLLPSKKTGPRLWQTRYREINAWERYLVDNGIAVVKLFLNVSRDEQRNRLLERIDDPEKNWKFSEADVHERENWDAYQKAYGAMLSATSTEAAPWHVLPADHKWFAQLAAAGAIVGAFEAIDPRYPKVSAQQREALSRAREQLLRD